ncbi:MAG: GspH/FimT family pseudopilin [Pseudomonadota bacterium]
MGKTDPGEKSLKRRSGFTMVELMITMVIIAALVGIAIPAFSVWMPNYRLKDGTRSLISAIQLARLTAIKENRSTVVWFYKVDETYRAFVDDGAGGGTAGDNLQNGTERTIIGGTMPEGVDIDSYSITTVENRTTFNNRGMSSDWGYVYLKNSKGRWQRITLYFTGVTEIHDSTNGTTWS